MSRHERFGTRDNTYQVWQARRLGLYDVADQIENESGADLTYSKWHRNLADRLGMIDIDWVDYCRRCNRPIALTESVMDVGQSFKSTVVLGELGRMCGLPVFLVMYDRLEGRGIRGFRVARICPDRTSLRECSTEAWGHYLDRLQDEHVCVDQEAAS